MPLERSRIVALFASVCVLLFPHVARADGAPGPKVIACASVAQLALKIENYQGTPYYFLANGELTFTIDVEPRDDHAMDLLWGAKNDERSAEVVVDGQRQTVTAGGYDGFQWIRVELPAGSRKTGYRVTLRKVSGKVAFVAAIRLVPKSVSPTTPTDLPTENQHITFQLPELLDGWPAVESYADLPLLERNGQQARRALSQSRRFVTGWLAKADPQSGLIPENLGEGIDRWNGRNNAADNYPFMVLTAALTDRPLFEGRMLEMLRSEERLTSRVDRLCDYYKFSTRTFEFDTVDMDRIIFDNSEYVKDGLMPLTEWLGLSPWSERMSGIIDDIWKHAAIETPAGKIPSTNPEVNGEMMQLTSRYFWMTGQRKYLDDAIRIADWYLLSNRHPTRDSDSLKLRDHGCELISGLTEVYFACSYADKAKARQYREPLYAILDCVLKYGVDEYGMMYNAINPRTGEVTRGGLSDNWGYNYNGFYTVYLLDAAPKYRDAVRHALSNLNHCKGYAWEGKSHDGYADSIESAINLYNREPIDTAAEWIDSQMRIMLAMQQDDGIIGGWHGDGNFARTAIMYALWKQQGLTIQPWREDVRLGAIQEKGTLTLMLAADKPWKGQLVFDIARHRTVMHMPQDYPRINQFPEWFTVDNDKTYRITGGDGTATDCSGKQLRDGLSVQVLSSDKPISMRVTSAE